MTEALFIGLGVFCVIVLPLWVIVHARSLEKYQ